MIRQALILVLSMVTLVACDVVVNNDSTVENGERVKHVYPKVEVTGDE